jgi:hypothetical protein
MSLLPLATYSSPATPLYATQAQLSTIVQSISTINVVSSNGSGITVTETTPNIFNVTTNLTPAGGISFLTYPGSTAVGLSNAGVNTLTGGPGVTITGTATAPVVNNSITASVNNVLDIWNSTPISVSTPVGGAKTTLVTYGSFVVGKTYLISFAGDIACGSTTISAGDKGMLMGIQPVGTGENLVFSESPVSYTGTGFATSFTYTAPQTSLQVFVQGDGTNTEVIIGTLSNVTIIQLN